MTYLDLTPDQSRQLRTEGKVRVWVEMDPQPLILDSGGAWYPHGRHPNARHYASHDHLMKGIAVDFAPHPPGTRARVREPWADLEDRGGWPAIKYVYEADGPRYLRWYPPEIMPDEAIRTEATCTAQTPEQRDGKWGFAGDWEVVG